MIKKYKTVSIIYGASGRTYAKNLNDKITAMERELRHPICSSIVMESILTNDILSSVISIFKETEICIAILTADDCCDAEGKRRLRLRQNVVFELGMALFHLGRENCILLSTFDPNDGGIELPSDMKSLEIKYFDNKNMDSVFNSVLEKILVIGADGEQGEHPCVTLTKNDSLFYRSEYYIDYEDLFKGNQGVMHIAGRNYGQSVLDYFYTECASLKHYDERAIYFLERIGILFAFSKNVNATAWYERVQGLLGHYAASDIQDCNSDRDTINAVRDLCGAVIRYTLLKSDPSNPPGEYDYANLCEEFSLISFLDIDAVNPLIATVYYDYLGLTYMKLYGFTKDKEHIKRAIECFEITLDKYVDKIDLGLSIWAGFLYFNLARAYDKLLDFKDEDAEYAKRAAFAFGKSVVARKRWISGSYFNDHVRYILSYEYFCAKIEHVHLLDKYSLKSKAYIEGEYQRIEGELNTYCSMDERLEGLTGVMEMLNRYRLST